MPNTPSFSNRSAIKIEGSAHRDVNVMSFSDGVAAAVADESTAWYWMYLEVCDRLVPGALSGENAVHVASGVGVSPNRALSATEVFAGVTDVHVAEPQLVVAPASSTREVNVPDGVYGLIRSQSTVSAPPAVLKSDAMGRMFAEIVTGCVATTAPSMRNLTLDVFHSMR
jgi:hypothetical protein